MTAKKTSARTKAVQADIGVDPTYNAVSPPLYLSSTYKFNGFENLGLYDYGRSGNPNREALGRAISDIEGGHDCYGGTHRLFTHRHIQGRLRVLFIDQNDPVALAAALRQKPKLVLIETPSNPLMRLVDIAAISHSAHKVGAKVVVDNTFLSPARQTPLALGADFVIHSTTKYLNGHSDVVGGCCVAKTKEDADKLAWWANCTGVTGSPFDSYMTLRGMRTLFARMDIAEQSAMAIASFLESHKAVEAVYYPGLESNSGYALMQRQQTGPGAMLSFTLKGGEAAVATLLENTSLFQLAESLGGTESLICHPATMTHRGMDAEARHMENITNKYEKTCVYEIFFLV